MVGQLQMRIYLAAVGDFQYTVHGTQAMNVMKYAMMCDSSAFVGGKKNDEQWKGQKITCTVQTVIRIAVTRMTVIMEAPEDY